MPQLLSFRPLFILLSLLSLSFGGPFDWHYNNMSTPFAVFYNPALLGNNPGSTFGVDMKYVDSANYDIRGAVVIPVGKVLKREDHLQMNYSRNRYFRYPNTSYRSSRAAVSVGGTYAGEGSYNMSAGFAAPVRFVQSGASLDMAYRGDDPVLSLNAGAAANIPSVVSGSGTLYLAMQNLAASGRDSSSRFKLSIGTSGISSFKPDVYSIPYDLFFRFHFSGGRVLVTEGTARISIDLTHLNTSTGTFGQTMAATLGYSLMNERGRAMDHRFFVNAGIVFINKKSTAALLGSYGSEEEMHGAFMYSSIKKETTQTDNDIYADITQMPEEDGKILFGLRSSGTTIRSWVLRIEDPSGASVRTYSGGNVVPSSVLWDGLSSEGAEVKDEILYAKLALKGNNKVVESRMITVELRR